MTLSPSCATGFGGPHQLRQFVEFARRAPSEGLSLEDVEEACDALPCWPAPTTPGAPARPAAARAARIVGEMIEQEYREGARDVVMDSVPSALAAAGGDPIAAARRTMERHHDIADPADVAEAFGLIWADGFLETVQRAAATGDAEWIALVDADEAALRFELAGHASLVASRAAPDILRDLPEGEDFADALLATHPLVTPAIAADVAKSTIRRLAKPPVSQYQPDPIDPWASCWEEPSESAVALHRKALKMLEARDDAEEIADNDTLAAAIAIAHNIALASDRRDVAAALNGLAVGAVPAIDEPAEPEPDAIRTDDRLADLCAPPGLVGEIVDWMEASSDRPNRALLLGAALTFVGTLAGRKFATPSNLRSNNYIVSLAPSGHGKEHAISRIKTLAAAAGLDRYVGPARIMSASALRKLVAREPSVGCYIDEFGGFMSQIHDRRAGMHNAMIRYDMLEMFSTAGTFFAGAEYAGEAATKIYAPNFSISGTSTPEAFWSSLSSLSASDGLLARLVLLDIHGPKPKRVKPRLALSEIPEPLIDAVRKLADAGGNLSALSSVAPTPKVVPFDAEAEAIDAVRIAEIDASEEVASTEAMPFVNRVREHALKLALIVAVGCNPIAPVITGPVLDWAYRLARLSAATLIRESADRIADNERGEAMNRILRMIRSAGERGVTPGRIADKQRGIDARLRAQILHDLVAAGRIIHDRQSGTGGRARERYIAA